MSYRPITDSWILARPKVPYYGAYPAGFLERARVFLPVTITDPVLHVCGGRSRLYSDPKYGVKPGAPLYGFGDNDVTLDADPTLDPDILADVTDPDWPERVAEWASVNSGPFLGVLVDPPYTPDDATHYQPGKDRFPDPSRLLGDCLRLIAVGGRVGFLHYIWPRPPKDLRDAGLVKCVAKISVNVGYNNRERCYSVWERRG